MDYVEGMAIPPGYTRESHIRKGLVIGGAVTFGSLWLITSIYGAAGMSMEDEGSILNTSEYEPEDWGVLIIPVAGPFIAIGTLDASAGPSVLLAIDGVAQAGGLAMLIAVCWLPAWSGPGSFKKRRGTSCCLGPVA